MSAHPPGPLSPDPHEAMSRYEGVRLLRRHAMGTLVMHERRAEVRFVVEGATGALVLPVEPGFATPSAELLLMTPAENDWDLQLELIAQPIDRPESLEACDRWSAYHGKSSSSTWIRCSIDGAKSVTTSDDSGRGPLLARVFEGERVQMVNPLGVGEYAVVRRVNQDAAVLARACRRAGGLDVPSPLCVGADPVGLDVKARFGIIRLEFPEGVVAETKERALAAVEHLLHAPETGTPARA